MNDVSVLKTHDVRDKTSAHACMSARFLRKDKSVREKRNVLFFPNIQNNGLVDIRETKIIW